MCTFETKLVLKPCERKEHEEDDATILNISPKTSGIKATSIGTKKLLKVANTEKHCKTRAELESNL